MLSKWNSKATSAEEATQMAAKCLQKTKCVSNQYICVCVCIYIYYIHIYIYIYIDR